MRPGSTGPRAVSLVLGDGAPGSVTEAETAGTAGVAVSVSEVSLPALQAAVVRARKVSAVAYRWR
jgi:hypothetical protein